MNSQSKHQRVTRCRLLSVLTVMFVLTSAPAASLDVIVVRHAQKDSDQIWDPHERLRPLNEDGARCAEQLAKKLKSRKINAVYSSAFARTLATAAAVSGSKVKLTGDDAVRSPDPDWAKALTELHKGGDITILIVGHSKSVGRIVLAFRPDLEGCLSVDSKIRLSSGGVPETQYGDVWILEDVEGNHGKCESFKNDPLGRNCKTK